MSPKITKSKAVPTQVTLVRNVPKQPATLPSALPPIPRFNPKVCSGNEQMLYLEALKQHIKAEFTAYYQMEREAAMRAVKMGLMLRSVKEILGHGAWMPWCEANISIKDRQINRFMKLAEFFLANAQIPRGETLLLGDGTETKEAKQAQQLLLDFIGDQSQAELFAKYGVTGGRREGSGRHRTQAEIEADEAALIWGKERLGEIAAHGIEKKSWRFLARPELETAFEVFRQTTEAMKQELKIRHGIK